MIGVFWFLLCFRLRLAAFCTETTLMSIITFRSFIHSLICSFRIISINHLRVSAFWMQFLAAEHDDDCRISSVVRSSCMCVCVEFERGEHANISYKMHLVVWVSFRCFSIFLHLKRGNEWGNLNGMGHSLYVERVELKKALGWNEMFFVVSFLVPQKYLRCICFVL